MYDFRWLSLLVAAILLYPKAYSLEAVKLSEIGQEEYLGLRSLVFSGDLAQIDEATVTSKFWTPEREHISMAFGSPIYWQYLKVVNDSDGIKPIHIWDRLASADEFQVLIDWQPAATNSSKNTSFDRAVSLNLQPQTTHHILIKRVTDTIQTQSWSFWSNLDDMRREIRFSQIFLTVFVVTFLMSMLFNAILWVSYRESVYLYYMFYLGCYGTFSTLLAGVFPGFTFQVMIPFASAALIFSICFSFAFLFRKDPPPLAMLLFKVIVAVEVFTIICSFVYPVLASLFLTSLCILNSVLIISTGIYCYLYQRSLYVLVFNVSFGVLMTGVLVQILSWYGIFPFLSDHVMDVAFMFENALMLTAIGLKIFETSAEKTHGFREMQKMLYPHQVNQIMSGDSLESTMPIGSETAAVLSFDVIHSSQIEFSDFDEKLEAFLVQCREKMSEGYQPSPLTSRGYMVKEMGDGFICSVGYPFGALSDNVCDEALLLAEDIVSLFDQHMNDDPQNRRVFCAVGIALGEVKAYFSKSGNVRHDLWGRGVILAKRYESFRKKLESVQMIDQQHLILLQDQVFRRLSSGRYFVFETLNLDESLRIRDDSEAKYIHISKIKSSRDQGLAQRQAV